MGDRDSTDAEAEASPLFVLVLWTLTPGEGILNLFPCTCRTSMLECALGCGGTLWLSSSKLVFRVNNHFEYERQQTVKQGMDG